MQSNILAQILNTSEIPVPEGDIFKALPNIYDGALLRKFSQKSKRILLEMFCKKGVLKNFAKSKGKHLCQSLFFNKVAGLRSATLLKKRLWYKCFPVNFVKLLRTPFYIEHLWWLLLKKPDHKSFDRVLDTTLTHLDSVILLGLPLQILG